MAHPRTSPDQIAAVQAAPATETSRELAERLGLSLTTVKRYRAAARQQREEATREIIREHAREHVSDALADLRELRSLAAESYREERAPPLGQLWLAAIRTELAQAGGRAGDDLSRMSDDELRAIVREELGE